MPSVQTTLHYQIQKKTKPKVKSQCKQSISELGLCEKENSKLEDPPASRGSKSRPRQEQIKGRGVKTNVSVDPGEYSQSPSPRRNTVDEGLHFKGCIRHSCQGDSEPNESRCRCGYGQRTAGSSCRPSPSKRLFTEGCRESDKTEPSHSPPKQSKNTNDSPKTPSHLISRLCVSSPSNAKTSDLQCISSPKKSEIGSSYQHVRRALHSSVTEEMPGREKQLSDLHAFLQSHLESNSSATLYISGPPGTGKTACLSKIMRTEKFQNGYKIVYVNCTSMKSAICIYKRIAEELAVKTAGKTAKDFQVAIEKYIMVHKKMILLVLDEIDQLDSRNQSVLYTIFEWPSKEASKLVLVGIANALDLTDRILPRLQSHVKLKPILMHFAAYSKEQIIEILSGRLRKSEASHVLTPVAVQLLAAKVASMSGDVRRALDMARRVVEKASEHSRSLKPTTDHAVNTSSPKKNAVSSVDLKEVMSVLNSAYGASHTLNEDCNETFPLQQKVLLCTLVLISTKGKTKDVTIGKLHTVYRRICAKRNLLAVCQAELLSLCNLVSTRGIIRLQPAKEPRLYKVCLQWDEEEVGSVLKDKQLLDGILKDTSCLQQ